MPGVEPWLEQSLTGLSVGPVPPRRLLIVENADLMLSLRVTDDDTRTLVRSTTAVPPNGHYAGSFLINDGSLDLADGTRLALKPYGLAAFLPLDRLTVLRVGDDDDFSAYLRDADEAFSAGLFADHVTHPNVLIADLAGLGADAARAGPNHRIFVFPDGRLSTSPTGLIIGLGSDSAAAVQSAWRELNERSSVPCAVCLGGVIGERDRSEAILQRPWLSRYVAVARAIRVARAAGALIGRASGFGGRLTGWVPPATEPDPPGAVVLLQDSGAIRVADPSSDAQQLVSARAGALLEAMVTFPRRADAERCCAGHLGIEIGDVQALLASLLTQLRAAGIGAAALAPRGSVESRADSPAD